MQLRVGIIGDFDSRVSHLATDSAIRHSAVFLSQSVEIAWIPTESLVSSTASLAKFDALLCSPGSPYRSMQGALNGIQHAREQNVPFLGTCGGFQHAVIEYARNVLGLTSTGHAEIDGESPGALVVPLTCSLSGAQAGIHLQADSRCAVIYGKQFISEKFRCNYGLSPVARRNFEGAKLHFSGIDENKQIVVMELADHPFFISTLFQPQQSSQPEQPHPLFNAFLRSATEPTI